MSDDFMTSGKAPDYLSFKDRQGVRLGGVILAGPCEYTVREYDARNPGQGPIKRDDQGNPVKGWYFDLQTNERNGPQDNGIRRLYVDKWRLIEAIKSAVLRAGSERPERGAALYVAMTGKEATDQGADANTWAADYYPPGSNLMGAPVTRESLPRPQYDMQSTPTPHFHGPQQVQPQVPQYPIHQSSAQPAYAHPEPVAPQQVQPAPAPSVVPVPAAVYYAMQNAGLSTAGYVIAQGV